MDIKDQNLLYLVLTLGIHRSFLIKHIPEYVFSRVKPKTTFVFSDVLPLRDAESPFGLEDYPEFPLSSVREENTPHQVGSKRDIIYCTKTRNLEISQKGLRSKVLQVLMNSK